MKKILLYAMVVVMAAFTSCSLDINDDPNHPLSATPALVMPSAQNAIATVIGDGMYNPAGFFVQYYDQMPESEQYKDLVRYMFTQSSAVLDRSYAMLYAVALEDLEDILKSNATTGADKFMATTLRALCFQLAVDNWDQAPYTEALKGNGNTAPKWDDGQSVYEGILNEMDSVESLITDETITCTDMIAAKNLTQWKGFANALRLRMYLRFIDAGINASEYTTKAKALVAQNEFFTGDFKFDNYKDEADRGNPWYSTYKVILNTTNHCAGYAIVSYLTKTGDTQRMAYGFAKATASGSYAGALPATKYAFNDIKNKDVSELNYYATKPVYFFTQAELQFLIAEVQLRFNSNDAAAKQAYEDAIKADFEARGLTGASDLYNGAVAWSTAGTVTDKLNLIYMQKWAALFYMDHMEAWSEQRRTDVPKVSTATAAEIKTDPSVYTAGELISPAVNALGAGVLVKRMYFPYNASQYNPNTPAAISADKPVWWDVK